MARGRPRQFDEQQALMAAMDVFWRKGFEGASCEELLAAMKIKAGSMYAAFGDKQTLYDRAFDLYCDRSFASMVAILDGPGTPLENVRALVRAWGEHMTKPDRRGCLIQNTVIEFSEHQDGVARVARQTLKRLQDMLRAKLERAAESGELSTPADPAALAAFLVNTVSGLNVLCRSGADAAVIRGAVDTALLVLQ